MHLAEALDGLSTIKSFKSEDRFISIIEKKINENQLILYSINYVNR